MKRRHLLLLLLPVLFMAGCAYFFVDRASGYPKLNNVAWRDKNIIIVLGMRTVRQGPEVVLPQFAKPRVQEAERLYRDCKARGKTCFILASGGDPAEHGVSEAAVIKRMLVENQIPSSDIWVEGNSTSTFHNAKYSQALLAQEAPDLTVLVTSDVHLLRAMRMFQVFNVTPLPAPAGNPGDSIPD